MTYIGNEIRSTYNNGGAADASFNHPLPMRNMSSFTLLDGQSRPYDSYRNIERYLSTLLISIVFFIFVLSLWLSVYIIVKIRVSKFKSERERASRNGSTVVDISIPPTLFQTCCIVIVTYFLYI